MAEVAPGLQVDQSPDALLAAVAQLPEEAFRNPDRTLNDPAFTLADKIASRVCVDVAPVRRNEAGNPELLAIERGTGRFAGRYCLIGGGLIQIQDSGIQVQNEQGLWVPAWVTESYEEAARRHLKTDLGVKEVEPLLSWDEPQLVAQDMRPINGQVRQGFNENPASRDLRAIRYMVTIPAKYHDGENLEFGTTAVGGQEALSVHWLDAATLEDLSDDAFGYDHKRTFDHFMRLATGRLAEFIPPAE